MNDIERIERRLKLHDMRVLLSVVEAGSMHKAAERLATSQPAISRSIAAIENALGVRLLERSSSGIRPTRYGEAIMRRGLAAFDELRQGVKDVEFLSDPASGELHIGCSEFAAGGPVLAVIDQLTRRHPRMVFNVVTGPVLTLYQNLTDRKIEMVVTRLVDLAGQENMEVERLFDTDIVAVAAAGNPWTRRRRVELAELVDEPWTLPPRDTGLGAFAERAFRAKGLRPPRTTVLSYSMHMTHKLLATGRFISMLPDYTLSLPGKQSSLRQLPVHLTDERGTLALVTLKKRALSPLAEVFIEATRAVAKRWARAR